MKIGSISIAITIALLASAATAQPVGDVTWYFELTGDAADGVIDLAAGESTAHLKLWADLNPDVNGQDVIGYALSNFDVVADGISGDGTIVANDPSGNGNPGLNELLTLQSEEYTLSTNNSFIGIQTFQLPAAFNIDHDWSDPILVLEFDWVSDRWTTGTVSYETTNRQSMHVYFSPLGGSQPWNPIETQVSWIVIPAPATLGLFALAGATTLRRRH